MSSKRLVARRETKSVVVSEVHYGPGLSMPRHGHEPAHISMVLCGGFQETMGQETREIGVPNVLFRAQEAEHAVRFGAVKTRILNVQLRPALLRSVADSGVKIGVSKDLTGARTSWIVARLYDEFRRKDSVSRLALDALVMELLVELGRTKSCAHSKAGMDRICELLRSSVARPPSLAELAAEAGMHPVSLSRAFRKANGCTLSTYLRQVRLEQATALLAKGDQSLAEIARELGFADQAHFTRTFKAATGFTPGHCRKAYGSG